jgi:DNA-binding transcriptional ArsR family regulator
MAELAAMEALAEPRRRALMDALLEGERPVNELVEHLGLSQPLISKHLRVLREAGLVEARVDGPRRLYRIRPQPLADLDDWLGAYRKFWNVRLDRLEDHLDERRKQ